MNMNILHVVIVTAGYLFTFLTSGIFVHRIIGDRHSGSGAQEKKEENVASESNIGTIIGKCENFLTVTFILANAYTGLALVFTAKSIIRKDDMKRNPKYFLGGTLVNFSYSVLMGFLIKILLNRIA